MSTTRDLVLTTPDGPMDCFEAVPDGPTRGAVVVVQEAFGVNAHIRDVTERFAAAGYHAVAPAYFHRAGGGRVEDYTDVAAIFPLFDAIIESSKSGVRKPDPRIYLMMCEMLSVKPQTCIYLDDLGVNCKPAAQLGMTAIKVTGETQALDDLERVTGLTFAR